MKLKDNKGFTLVELVISISITAVISMAVISVFMYTFNSFFNTSNTSEMRTILNGIKSEIIDELTYAKQIYITDTADENLNTFHFKDGRLYGKKDLPVFPEDFYLDNTVSGSFSSPSSAVVTFNLTITNSKGKTIELQTSVKTINLALNMQSVSKAIGSSGNKLNYK